jgi:hypothetical protein
MRIKGIIAPTRVRKFVQSNVRRGAREISTRIPTRHQPIVVPASRWAEPPAPIKLLGKRAVRSWHLRSLKSIREWKQLIDADYRLLKSGMINEKIEHRALTHGIKSAGLPTAVIAAVGGLKGEVVTPNNIALSIVGGAITFTASRLANAQISELQIVRALRALNKKGFFHIGKGRMPVFPRLQKENDQTIRRIRASLNLLQKAHENRLDELKK